MADSASRSVRTLAWLGDAEFEREVRIRVIRRGDFPTRRLDAIKAEIVRAPAQAALLQRTLPALDEDERSVVQRGRNAALPRSARGRKMTQEYRAATGLEALVGHWRLADRFDRFAAVFDEPLEDAIEHALQRVLARAHPRGRD